MISIPDELQRAAPRSVRLTGQGTFVLGLAYFLAVLAPLAATFAYLQAEKADKLAVQRASSAQVTEARVTKVVPRKGEKNMAMITYMFRGSGGDYTDTIRLRQREVVAKGIREGTTLRIGYLPDNPTDSWLVGREPRGGIYWLSPLIFFAIAIGAGAIWFSLKRDIRLLENGRGAVATATGSKRVRHQHGHIDSVLFDYQTLSGASRKGSVTTSKMPAVGDQFVVVYDPDNAKRVARYPMKLVRTSRSF